MSYLISILTLTMSEFIRSMFMNLAISVVYLGAMSVCMGSPRQHASDLMEESGNDWGVGQILRDALLFTPLTAFPRINVLL